MWTDSNDEDESFFITGFSVQAWKKTENAVEKVSLLIPNKYKKQIEV